MERLSKMEELVWIFSPFEELTLGSFYDICAARQEVFIVGQKLSCIDCDGLDQGAWHLQGRLQSSQELIAYLRVLVPKRKGEGYQIGRILTRDRWRGQGYGRLLMKQVLKEIAENFGAVTVTMSAQAHLEKFYESCGFQVVSGTYVEEGLPHIKMQRQL